MLIERIADRQSRLRRARDGGVFADLTIDRALAEARHSAEYLAQGLRRRALEGVLVAWKDVFDVAGYPTRAGTRFLGHRPADRDHQLVARLASHGAICVGKTSLSELAVSALGENDAQPAPSNPHDRRRVCGGSSSGAAAAVALGLADIGIGTDCGGSVRLPAAWCGVVGFKPTWQPIDRSGAVPFSPSLDTVGILAPTARHAAQVYCALEPEAMTTAPARDSVQLRRAPLPRELMLDTAVGEIYGATLAALTLAGMSTPEANWNPMDKLTRFRRRFGSTAADEGAALWRQTVLDAGALASPRLRQWFVARTRTDATARRRARLRIQAEFSRAVPQGTVMITPSSPIEPPQLASLHDRRTYQAMCSRANALLWPFNELDAPAISIPCGYTDTGLPAGLQLVAPPGRDADVLTAACAIEATLTGSALLTLAGNPR